MRRSQHEIGRERVSIEQWTDGRIEDDQEVPTPPEKLRIWEANFLENWINDASINELSTLGFNIHCELMERDRHHTRTK